MDDLQYFLRLSKSTIEKNLLTIACEKSNCRLSANDPMAFYYLGMYIGKIKAQAQFN